MLQIFLLVIFLCFFAYLAWIKPIWATALTAAFLPSYLIRFSLGPIPSTLLEAMVILLFAAWAIQQRKKIISRFRESKRDNWFWIITAWLVFATISLFISPNFREAAGIWKAYFIEPILFLIVFANVIKEKKDVELIFYSLGFSALYISAFAVYQKFTGVAIPNPIWQAAETRRVTSLYGYPNAVGLYLAPIVTLYAGWIINKLQTKIYKLREIIFQFSTIVFSAAAIVFARSEGACVGILAGLFFLGIMTKKIRWTTLAVTVVLGMTVLLIPQTKNYAWQQISFQNDSGKVRISQWQETWTMLRDRPLVGAGLAGYQEMLAPYHKAKHIEIYLYPHNLFLNFWSELSLGGLLVFLLIVAKFLKNNIEKLLVAYYWPSITLMAIMITILIHGLVDVPYFKNDLSVFFWLLVGLSLLDFKKISAETV